MPFVREKGGQVLVVRSVRTGAHVRQEILTRISSMDLLARIVENDSWEEWSAQIAWRHPEVEDWDWPKIRQGLKAALRRFRGALDPTARKTGVVERSIDEATQCLGRLSTARADDDLVVQSLRPRLEKLQAEIARLLSRPLLGANAPTEANMSLIGDDRKVNAESMFDEGMGFWWVGDRASACRSFRKALRLDPSHADAHNHLGIVALEREKLPAAEKHFTNALASGAKQIERDDGLVPWGILENRPYLRAMGNLALVRRAQGKYREALAMHEEMLRMNPNDNQGVRFLLPEEYLRIGDPVRASAKSPDGDEPGALFTRALALIVAKAEPRAIGQALLHAFGANRYATPMLLGERWERLDGFHAISWAEPEAAGEYVEQAAALWLNEPTSASTLRFWWRSAPVVAWREEVDATIVALGKLEVGEQRGACVSRQGVLRSMPRIAEVVARVMVAS